MPTQHYVTTAALAAAIGVSEPEAEKLLDRTEALIDNALGPYAVHASGPAEGRKIAAADVNAWQYERLQEAVVALARRLNDNPGLGGPEYESISGPDFSVSGAKGPVYGAEVAGILSSSGLVVRSARART